MEELCFSEVPINLFHSIRRHTTRQYTIIQLFKLGNVSTAQKLYRIRLISSNYLQTAVFRQINTWEDSLLYSLIYVWNVFRSSKYWPSYAKHLCENTRGFHLVYLRFDNTLIGNSIKHKIYQISRNSIRCLGSHKVTIKPKDEFFCLISTKRHTNKAKPKNTARNLLSRKLLHPILEQAVSFFKISYLITN